MDRINQSSSNSLSTPSVINSEIDNISTLSRHSQVHGQIETATGVVSFVADFDSKSEQQSNHSEHEECKIEIGHRFNALHEETELERNFQRAEAVTRACRDNLNQWHTSGTRSQQQEIAEEIGRNHQALLELLNSQALPDGRRNELQSLLENDNQHLEAIRSSNELEPRGESKDEKEPENVERALVKMSATLDHAEQAIDFLRSAALLATEIEPQGTPPLRDSLSSLSSSVPSVDVVIENAAAIFPQEHPEIEHQEAPPLRDSLSSRPSHVPSDEDQTNAGTFVNEESSGEVTTPIATDPTEAALENDPRFQDFVQLIGMGSNRLNGLYQIHANNAQHAENHRDWSGASIHWASAAHVARAARDQASDYQIINNERHHHAGLTDQLNDELGTWRHQEQVSRRRAGEADVNARGCCATS